MAQVAKKRLLITGGARGIGRAAALLAGARGWSVAVNYRANREMADQTVADLQALGGQGIALQGDVSQEADVLRVFSEAHEVFGALDAVVINAGIVGPSLTLAEMSVERLQHMLDTNLLGALLCAREAARRLPRPQTEPSAAIVLLSSVAAKLGSPFEYVDYAASKGALDTLTIGLSKELAPQNIRVNAVRPGLIETEIHASGGQPGRAKRLGAQVPMARPGMAEEVAEAVIWLCSDAAFYTTGALLDVGGGR